MDINYYCEDTVGYLCELFLPRSARDGLCLVYPSIVINKFSGSHIMNDV